MKIHLPRAFWRTSIKFKYSAPVVAIFFCGLRSQPLLAGGETRVNSWNIESRLRVPSMERHDDGSELAGSQAIELNVLRLSGSLSRDDAPTSEINLDLDLAASSQHATCRRHIQNDVKQQRCRIYPLRRFSAVKRFPIAISMEFGMLEIPQNGWLGYTPASLRFLEVMNFDQPFDDSQPSVKLALTGVDEVSATITNDVSTAFPSVGEFTDTRTQPTIVLEWKQSKCRWCGLVQWGNYDLNHSQFLNVGARVQSASFHGFVDIGVDARERKYLYRKRRSMRWHSTLQGEYTITAVDGLSLQIEGFRMFSRGLPGEEDAANRPGMIDQNLSQASLVYLRTPVGTSDWRYFIELRGSTASVYATYPSGPVDFKQQASVACGIVSVLKGIP